MEGKVMDIKGILKKVGSGIVRNIFPAAGAVIDIVNECLPEDKKLDQNATGLQVEEAINTLPADQKVAIMSKRLDVEIEEIRGWSSVVHSLSEADASGSSTRPWIAKLMGVVVALTIIVFMLTWTIAIVGDKKEMVKAISDGWPMVATLLGFPMILLRAYFGLRTEEKKARYANATGNNHVSGVIGTIKSLFNK
jgi:hypothetical protein